MRGTYFKKRNEFSEAHYDLPGYCGMFDLDKMKGKGEIELEITKQNVGYIEYRTDFTNARIKEWVAIFELKHKMTDSVQKIIDYPKLGGPTWAQIQLAATIGARFFFVIANNGIQPFDFYEAEIISGELAYVDTLDYDSINRCNNINHFWRKLKLMK